MEKREIMGTTSSSSRGKGRKPRADKGVPQLTQRDLDVLRRIGEQTAYRFDQLQELLAHRPDTRSEDPDILSETRTSALIGRWKRLELADYRKIRYDEPGWVWLTRKGLYHCDLPMRFLDPCHSDLEHLFWINETRILVEEKYGSRPGFRWESERQYRVTREHFKTQQRCEPDIWIPREYQSTHRPDGLLRYRLSEDEDAREIVIALETELSEKDYQSWKSIFLDLTSYYHAAHYYVAPEIKAMLVRALERFKREVPEREWRHRIFVYDLEPPS